MALKYVLSAALAFGAAGAGYWHYSPYLAIQGVRSAVDQQDPESFNRYIDYAKLRESLKTQLTAKVAAEMGTEPTENIGGALALAFVNQLVDALVKPEMVMAAMKEGHLGPKTADAGDKASQEVTWAVTRDTLNRVVVHGQSADSTEKVGVVFERYGFASWKLTGIELP